MKIRRIARSSEKWATENLRANLEEYEKDDLDYRRFKHSEIH